MSSSSRDAARLLLDEANGFKKFNGSLSPTESPAERRDRWRTWREVFGAACGIRNCAAVLTDDKPSGFDSKQIEIMQTDAKYLALIALSGPAKQWFLSDTTPPANGTIMNFMQHFEKIFAANERKDQDSVTKTWNELRLSEDGDAMTVWTALKTINSDFWHVRRRIPFLIQRGNARYLF